MASKTDFHRRYRFILGLLAIVVSAMAVNREACQSGRARNLLSNLATPYSGEAETHAEEVNSTLRFLRAKQVDSIKLSELIAANRFIAQPLTEGAYPITVSSSAGTLVSYSAEALPADCAILHIEKGIRIADCR